MGGSRRRGRREAVVRGQLWPGWSGGSGKRPPSGCSGWTRPPSRWLLSCCPKRGGPSPDEVVVSELLSADRSSLHAQVREPAGVVFFCVARLSLAGQRARAPAVSACTAAHAVRSLFPSLTYYISALPRDRSKISTTCSLQTPSSPQLLFQRPSSLPRLLSSSLRLLATPAPRATAREPRHPCADRLVLPAIPAQPPPRSLVHTLQKPSSIRKTLLNQHVLLSRPAVSGWPATRRRRIRRRSSSPAVRPSWRRIRCPSSSAKLCTVSTKTQPHSLHLPLQAMRLIDFKTDLSRATAATDNRHHRIRATAITPRRPSRNTVDINRYAFGNIGQAV